MGFMKLGGMSMRRLFSKPLTKRYPDEPYMAVETIRGAISIDVDSCIFCSLCARGCPTGALEVSKQDKTWKINRFSCIHCASCIRDCPKNCLSSTGRWTYPAADRHVWEIFSVKEGEESEGA